MSRIWVLEGVSSQRLRTPISNSNKEDVLRYLKQGVIVTRVYTNLSSIGYILSVLLATYYPICYWVPGACETAMFMGILGAVPAVEGVLYTIC